MFFYKCADADAIYPGEEMHCFSFKQLDKWDGASPLFSVQLFWDKYVLGNEEFIIG